MRIVLLMVCTSLCMPLATLAQGNNAPPATGRVKGIAFDSVHRFVMKAATVAIYRAAGKEDIVGYQLTNNFGEFNLPSVPRGLPLKLVISHVGYKTAIFPFTLAATDTLADLGKLTVYRSEQELEQVEVVYTPPVRMNHDTLEFNASAFTVGENGVVEDLLKKLPGVTVWGDGSITVNGREVKSVVVNGKPFFGSQAAVALQNIPKEAVQKVQVYQKSTNPQNTLDSTAEMNIKLKKGREQGVFGKVGAGYGTGDRKEAVANLNVYSPRTQFAIGGGANNVNKRAVSTQSLLAGNTFKSDGNHANDRSDWQAQGINRPIHGGFMFEHDLLEGLHTTRSNMLKGDYFVNQEKNQVERDLTTVQLISNDQLTQRHQSRTTATVFEQQANAAWDYRRETRSFSIRPYFTGSHRNSHYTSTTLTTMGRQTPTSSNVIDNGQDIRRQQWGLNGNWSSGTRFIGGARVTDVWTGQYALSVSKHLDEQQLSSRFTSLTDAQQNQYLQRHNRYDNTYYDLQGEVKYNNFARIQVNRWLQARLSTGTEVAFYQRTQQAMVQTFDTTAKFYLTDPYLTNATDYRTLTVRPFLNLKRTITKHLTDRYYRFWDLNLLLKGQSVLQKNTGSHPFQYIDRQYVHFIPTVSARYNRVQYGRTDNTWSASFAVQAGYPHADQLVRLTDSANKYEVYTGNTQLQPWQRLEWQVGFDHKTLKTKNPLNYNANLRWGQEKHYISDSTSLTTDGRRVQTPVNVDGYRYATLSLTMNKAIRIGTQAIQVMVNADGSMFSRPAWLNGTFYRSSQSSGAAEIALFYYMGSRVKMELGQQYSVFNTRQPLLNRESITSSIHTTRLLVSATPTDRLTIASNISFNTGRLSASGASRFAIWNASISQRFLKKSNLEVKVAAFDLLKQNSNLIRYGSGNTMTLGTSNVLQQYFMVGVAYFPRMFGGKKK